MTAPTSVPQSSRPLPREGIGGLLSLVSTKGIHLQCTWAKASTTRPQGGSLGKLRAFPGGSLRAQVPSVAGRVPMPPLTTAGHLHPAISGSASLGLGPLGPERKKLA